jgi:hypothetical protein
MQVLLMRQIRLSPLAVGTGHQVAGRQRHIRLLLEHAATAAVAPASSGVDVFGFRRCQRLQRPACRAAAGGMSDQSVVRMWRHVTVALLGAAQGPMHLWQRDSAALRRDALAASAA